MNAQIIRELAPRERRHRNSRCEIFTLIELIVVMAIIAMLVSLLVPALGKAKAYAISASCIGNLKQIGISNASYMTDSNDYIVMPGYQPEGVGLAYCDSAYPWDYVLSGYDVAQKRMFTCPADKAIPNSEGGPYLFNRPLRSYRINAICEGVTYFYSSPELVAADNKFPGGKRLSAIRRSMSDVMLFLCMCEPGSTYQSPVGSNRRYCWCLTYRNYCQQRPWMTHCRANNYAMVDGSASSIQPDELYYGFRVLAGKWWVIRNGVPGILY